MTFGSLLQVDSLITLIYQAPLEPKPWQAFLRALRERLNCDIAAMTIRPNGTGVPEVFTWDSHKIGDQEWSARFIEGALLRLRDADLLGKALDEPGSLATLDEVMGRGELMKSEYYQTLMRPYGIEYQLGMCFCEPSGWKCNVGIMNGPGRENFGEDVKALFQSFHSHLERALEIHARLRLTESEKEIFQETLDRLAIGTFILDRHGKIIEANRVALYTAQRNSSISIAQNKIALKSPNDDRHLNRLIRDALAWREKPRLDNFVDVMRVEAPNGSNLDLVVRTVTATNRSQSDVSPTVIVYVGDSVQRQLAPDRFIAQLFGLTPSEAFLATLLADGFTLVQAATKLEVTENTVRSYVKKVFAKMGVSRQVDLVRLVLKSIALLA